MGFRRMKTLARKWLMPLIVSLVFALALPAHAFAKPRDDAGPPSARPNKSERASPANTRMKSPEEAARQAARQHDAARVLSVRTVKQGNRTVHVVKLLTRDGVVKTVRVPADGR